MLELVTALNSALKKFAPDYVTRSRQGHLSHLSRHPLQQGQDSVQDPHRRLVSDAAALEKHGAAGFYFAMSHKDVDVGGGIYMPSPETLLAVRTHIARRFTQEFRTAARLRAR